jgi:hypothetical protein
VNSMEQKSKDFRPMQLCSRISPQTELFSPPPHTGAVQVVFTLGRKRKITIYASMIYTAPFVMFLLRADTLRGQVGGGWALEMESFLGPVKWHRADRRVPFGAQKTRDASPAH